jgi:hypothetical protein
MKILCSITLKKANNEKYKKHENKDTDEIIRTVMDFIRHTTKI